MTVIERLSSSTGKRSKEVNKALAKEIADKNDLKSIKELIGLLDNKNRNIQSDSIEVIYEIGYLRPDLIADYYEIFVDKGSVITKDAGVAVYANLATVKNQKAEVLPMLFDELKECPDKQLAQYAEKSLIAIDKDSKEAFLGIINLRLKSLEKESQIKRVKKVLKEVEKA